jgi:hypothetical protein
MRDEGEHGQAWWKSTAELEVGRVYALHGSEYRLQSMNVVTRGYRLSLKNVRSRQLFNMEIQFKDARRRVWDPR